MKLRNKILQLILAAALFTSCATIFKGDKQAVSFKSEPSNATVIINGQERGATPLTLKLTTKETYRVRFVKDGVSSPEYLIDHSISGGYVVLDVLGGVIPVLVDAVTGAWFNLDTNELNGNIASK